MRSSLSLLVLVPLVGCVATSDFDTGTSTQSVVINNRIAANRIAANRIAANRIAANRIAANRIAANRLTLDESADDLIETEDGREVLTYIVSCAIADGVTLVGTDSNGVQYEFAGAIGLAPGWLHHRLDERSKRWISACLFARVNAHDFAVPVSLRGPTDALATTADEQAGWPAEEGAFYGQYFLPLDQPIAWFACRGRDSDQAHADERDCAIPDPADPTHTLCGFNFAGDCGDFARPANRVACQRFSDDGYYVGCADEARFGHDADDDDLDLDEGGGWPHGDHHPYGHHGHLGGDHGHGHHGTHGVYHEVITTFVQL